MHIQSYSIDLDKYLFDSNIIANSYKALYKYFL